MMIEVKVSFDHDRDAAMARDALLGRARADAPEQKAGVEDPVEMQRLADELPVERTASRFIVSTDPDEHVEAIGRYVDLGFTHLVFHAPGPDQEKFLRLYGAEILPRLRATLLTAAGNAIARDGLMPGVTVPSSAMRRALRRARDGVALDATEAEILLAARGDDLVDLCASAARVRDAGLAAAGRPGVVTYSRKVFIPLTRLCRDRCHYCTFATTPNRRRRRRTCRRTRCSRSPRRARRWAARRRCSPSATARGPLAARPASGSTRTATTRRWPTCGRWRSWCWRGPACCRT